jgi:hypothetical protein
MCVYVLTIWPEQFECRTATESTTSLEHQWLWKWKRKPARSVPFVPFHGPSPLCLDLFLPQRERRGGWELLSRSYSTPSSSLNPPPPKIHIRNINSLWKYRKPKLDDFFFLSLFTFGSLRRWVQFFCFVVFHFSAQKKMILMEENFSVWK